MNSRSHCLITALAAAAVVLAGCGPPLQEPKRPLEIEVPPYLEGTVGQRALVAGLEPVWVQGYGLVTGLNDTGSTVHPPGLRDRMIKELARDRVPEPARLLADRTTAVVSVIGMIPPGSRPGESFDLSVRPAPGSDATSLEGGVLLETELTRVEPARTGAARSKVLAMGRGAIFVSPFLIEGDVSAKSRGAVRPIRSPPPSSPGQAAGSPAGEQPQTDPRLGTILGGGRCRFTRNFYLRLPEPSERTADQIARHINARFPKEKGKDIAKGKQDGATIDLSVPQHYMDDKPRFLNVVSALYLIDRPARREIRMRQLVDELRKGTDPVAVTAALEAFGNPVVSLLVPLLEDPNAQARFRAARAMAFLGRTDCIGPLEKLVRDDNSPYQEAAVRALGELPLGAGSAVILKAFDASNPTVRIAAYTTLEQVAPHLLPAVEIPNKFHLAVVESKAKPFIFVSRQEKARVVIFGDVKIEPPLLVDTPRYLASVRTGQRLVTMLNKKYGTRSKLQVSLLLADVAAGMARPLGLSERNRQVRGLNLSYSDVVGFIHRASREKAIGAPLKLEPIRFIGPSGDRPKPEFGKATNIPIPDK